MEKLYSLEEAGEKYLQEERIFFYFFLFRKDIE